MRSAEENYYYLLEDLKEFKRHLGRGQTETKPQDLAAAASDAWDKATELESVLNSEDFEKLLP